MIDFFIKVFLVALAVGMAAVIASAFLVATLSPWVK